MLMTSDGQHIDGLAEQGHDVEMGGLTLAVAASGRASTVGVGALSAAAHFAWS